MIHNVKSDIFIYPGLSHIVHQANLFHTFGSGIAREIRRRFPEAYNADLATKYGDHSKLGSYSAGVTKSAMNWGDNLVIVNMYSQIGIDAKQRTTDYNHMQQALLTIRSWLDRIDGVRLGFPNGIGCGLAGGDWSVVQAMIETIFKDAPFDTVICQKGD